MIDFPTAFLRLRKVERSATRQQYFNLLLKRNFAIRVSNTLFQKLSKVRLSFLLTWIYGVAVSRYYIKKDSTGYILSIAITKNEARKVRYIAQLLGAGALRRLDRERAFPTNLLRMPAAFFNALYLLKCLPAIYKISKHFEFFLALRLSRLLCSYVHFSRLLTESKLKAVLVASDYGPEALALSCAGTRKNLPVIFTPHAYPVDYQPRLKFNLSLLDGRAMEARYASLGPIEGKVAFCGLAGDSIALQLQKLSQPPYCVGIFTSGPVNLEMVANLTAKIPGLLAVRKLLIRLHPNTVWSSRLNLNNTGNSCSVEISKDRELSEDSSECDLIIAGNGSVHLDALHFGTPTVYLAGLDFSKTDSIGIVADGVVPFLSTIEKISIDDIRAFYVREGWEIVFRRYDEGYLMPSESSAVAVESAVNELTQKC